MIRYLILIGLVVLVFPVAYANANADCDGLRITEIRSNAIGRDTGPASDPPEEGEWFELKNTAMDTCTIVGSTLGFDQDAWKFVEDNGGHLLPNEDITIVMEPQETIVMAAFPTSFEATYPLAVARVFDIANNPKLRNRGGDFLEIRNSANQGSELIDRVVWDFDPTDEFSIHILSDRTIVRRPPSPGECHPEGIPPFIVETDIKPASDPNSINPFRKGVIPVAILGSDTFDVGEVYVDTLAFGPGGASPTHRDGHFEDVNGDGLMDLVTHYRTQETGLLCGDTEATLRVETFDGLIAGCDFVNMVGCE